MATPPEPPRPPVPPSPPRSGSNVVPIALLILALIVVVSATAVWIGLRFLSHSLNVRIEEGKDGKKGVSIETPVMSLDVNREVDEARLGLPIYPGAKRLKDEKSATVNIGVPGEENVRIVVAKFETPDSLEKVKEFYKQRLGSQVTKFKQRTAEGKTVFEIKHGGQEKVVALKPRWSGTEIDLVRVQESKEGTN